MASLRSLARQAPRLFSRVALRPVGRVAPALAARGYKSGAAPARDLMTGENIQLPDIDVRSFGYWESADKKAATVEVTMTEKPKAKPASNKLVFGHTFTDHMLAIPWNSKEGWGTPKIYPCTFRMYLLLSLIISDGPLALDPSSTVLHYAFTLFVEVLKLAGTDFSASKA